MIIKMEPLSMPEVAEAIKNKEKKKEIETYIKKFSKISKEKADKIRKEIEALNNIKIKSEHIVKIIDLLPEDASDVNKIFSDISLDENETSQIIEIVKKNK